MSRKARRDGATRDAPAANTATEAAIPGWVPAALFVGLALVLFRAFVFSDKMLFGGDTLSLGYVARAFYAQSLKTLGTFPLWNPQLLGGTPFLEALSGGDSLYPPSVLLLLIMEPYRALGWKLVLHVMAAGFFMFGWVRSIGASRPAALLGGTAYMLAPFFVSYVHPGHDGKMFVTALAPLLFWAVERHFVAPRLRTFSSIALVVGLVILTTHFQMAYFLFGGVGLFAIFRTAQAWRGAPDESASDPRPRRRAATVQLAWFLAAAVAGAGVAAVQLLPAVEYVTASSRRIQTTREAAQESGVAWSSSWSLHPEEAMSLVVPEFPGNSSGVADWTQGSYWGRNAFKDNHEYAGIVVLLLALVSFIGGARPALRWFFLALGSVALLFALGTHTPVWRLAYELLPGIRLFRAPSQAIFLFGFGAVTLAALGVDRILRLVRDPESDETRRVTRVLWGATAAIAALALLASSGVLTSLWTSTLYRDVSPDRLQALDSLQPFLARGAWVAALLALAVSALTWSLRARMLPPTVWAGAIVALAAMDALRVDAAFVDVLDFREWSAPDANLQRVLELETGNDEPYRLLSFRQAGQDVLPALHGIELAGGHHPNDLARYRELIGMPGSSFPENLLAPNIRRLLNVKYILWPDLAMGQSIPGPVVSRLQLRDGRPYETILADNGLPRARLVGAAVVKSDDEAVPYMLSDRFDPEREVVLAEAPASPMDGGPVQGSVTWLERGPNLLRLTVQADRPALLVVADNWFPAWHATVNGSEEPVLRAYHTLRAVPVPAGSSTVEMRYRSSAIVLGLRLTVLFLTIVLGAAALDFRRSRQPEVGP